MEREVKFRGKRLDTGEWIYGSLRVYDAEGYTGYYITELEHWGSGFEVDPKTVGQYVGRLRGNKDIYEGDWVRSEYNIGITEPIHDGYIEYSSTHGCFGIRNGVLFHSIIELTLNKWKIEPLDNIHDNPKLLEGTA